jgi:hypothetical protein
MKTILRLARRLAALVVAAVIAGSGLSPDALNPNQAGASESVFVVEAKAVCPTDRPCRSISVRIEVEPFVQDLRGGCHPWPCAARGRLMP